MHDCYITASGAFLPGEPVPNDRILDHIGAIDERSERIGKLVLRQNRIETRHYAIDAARAVSHSNAEMAALAARAAIENSEISGSSIDFLAAATTQGDLLVPGHASAVHAELSDRPIEIASFQSVCAGAMMAAKMGLLQVRAGESSCAMITGSEFSSRWFQPGFYRDAATAIAEPDARMSAEFLRWTLSDGAGAILLEPRPNDHGMSFRIDWISLTSLANCFDTCMYAGIPGRHRGDGHKVWSHYPAPKDAARDGAIMLMQDFPLLKRIIRGWIGEYLKLVDAGRIEPDAVDWLLCHYSAHSLREEIVAILRTTDAMIDEERWFTNLPTKGNTGSAALFVMLEEFMRTGRARPGQQILCIVPESGRAVISFMMLTAV